MTGRERVIKALNHEEPDRVPRYDSFWEETIAEYGFNSAELAKKYDFDMIVFSLDNSMRMPTRREDLGEWEIVEDRCGYRVKRRKGKSLLEFISHVNGCYETWLTLRDRFALNKNGESRVDTAAYFLRTDSAPTWEQAIRNMNDAGADQYRLINFYGPYEGTWRHHGFENSLMDLLAEPEYVTEMYQRITDLTIETLEYAISLGMKIDGAWMVEDLGCTKSSLMSPDVYRKMIFPWHKKIGDYLKSRNLKFFVHSCGNIEVLLPDLITAGVDVIQPLQANTGMHVAKLKEKYGSQITFWGNINVMELAKGEKQIEEEIRSKVVPAMRGGGYLYHSDHSIPPEVTLEKYDYMMKMMDFYGKYPSQK